MDDDNPPTVREHLVPISEGIHELARETGKDPLAVTGIATGYVDYDAVSGGLHSGTLSLFAARPCNGLTAFLTGIGVCNAFLKEKSVLFFTPGTPIHRTTARVLSAYSRIPVDEIRSNRIRKKNRENFAAALKKALTAKLFLNDSCVMEPEHVLDMIRSMNGVDLVLIDDLQHLQEGSRLGTDHAIADEFLRRFRLFARKSGIPFVVGLQLPAWHKATGARPHLRDLRSPFKFADQISTIYRAEVYKPIRKRSGELTILRDVRGRTGWIKLGFRHEIACFEDYGRVDQEKEQEGNRP